MINVPIAKSHGSAALIMGMKNWMGVMGGRRGEVHGKLRKSIVDGLVKSRLSDGEGKSSRCKARKS